MEPGLRQQAIYRSGPTHGSETLPCKLGSNMGICMRSGHKAVACPAACPWVDSFSGLLSQAGCATLQLGAASLAQNRCKAIYGSVLHMQLLGSFHAGKGPSTWHLDARTRAGGVNCSTRHEISGTQRRKRPRFYGHHSKNMRQSTICNFTKDQSILLQCQGNSLFPSLKIGKEKQGITLVTLP